MVDDGRTTDDGRRTTDGRTPDHGHPISSPCEPDGSGELKTAGWKQDSVFMRFYNRPVSNNDTFSMSILNSLS